MRQKTHQRMVLHRKPRRRTFPQKGGVLVRGTQHLKMLRMALLYRS